MPTRDRAPQCRRRVALKKLSIPRQDFVRYYQFHVTKHGEAPTMEEMASYLGVARETCGQMAKRMVADGQAHRVKTRGVRGRSLRLGPAPQPPPPLPKLPRIPRQKRAAVVEPVQNPNQQEAECESD